MEHYIITIAREFGSLGRTIGKKVAQNLGIEYYDRKLMEDAAGIMNTQVTQLAEYDEKLKNRLAMS